MKSFLTHKERLRDNAEIQPRIFTELNTTGVRIADAFGKQRLAQESANGPMQATILPETNCGLGDRSKIFYGCKRVGQVHVAMRRLKVDPE